MLIYSRPTSMSEPFTQIPNAALADARLSPTAKTVLALAMGWNPRQFAQFSAAEVSRRLGGSPAQAGLSAVTAAFKRLESAGYLTRTRRGSMWMYELHPFATSPTQPELEHPASDVSVRPEEFRSSGDFPTSTFDATTDFRGSPTTDFPGSYYQEDSKIPSSAPPGDTAGLTAVSEQEEAVTIDDLAAPVADFDARAWLTAVAAGLPLGARPSVFTADLVAQAHRWADLDAQLVAAALAPTYPYPVVSPAGLLLKKLRDLDVIAVDDARIRAAVAAQAAAATAPLVADDAADPEAVAAYVAQVRAALVVDGTPGADAPADVDDLRPAHAHPRPRRRVRSAVGMLTS